jgi:drug/metabolite transporter (DMT)-like permease
MGEIYALLSAVSFGIAGAAVAKGASKAKGDNGVFLSIWLACGIDLTTVDDTRSFLIGIGFFISAGVLATVFGRLTNFRSIALSGAIRSSLFRRLIPVFSTALAFVLLQERYSVMVLVGMIVILCSIAVAMWVRVPQISAKASAISTGNLQLGLLLAAVSAFCYALAYIARKLALEDLPDAALGALVGALTGVVWYFIAACISVRYRMAITSVLKSSGIWQWMAALGMSFGQILLFFALLSAPVAVVAIIGSLEMFVGAYFAAFLFKSEPVPGRAMILATIVAAIGVAMVAMG